MNKFIFVALTGIIILLITAPGRAVEFEGGIGISKLQTKNGIWYQEEFDHDISKYSPSLRLGVRFDAVKNVKLHFGYSLIATSESDALASASDENYWGWREGKNDIWPLSTWKTEGYTHGLYALASYWLPHDFYLKGGLWLHRSKVEVDIPDWRCASNENGACQWDHPNPKPSDPMPLKVKSTGDIRPGWVFGFGKAFHAKAFDVELEYSAWDIADGDEYPPVHRGVTHNFSINLVF